MSTESHEARGLRREAARAAVLAALGAVAGIAAKVADDSGVRAVNDIANYPAGYVLALAVLARLAPTALLAAVRAACAFTALCSAYYAWTYYVVGFAGGWYAFVWGALAVTFVPAAAAGLTRAYRSTALLAGLAVAVAAAVPLTEGPLVQLWLVAVRGAELPLLHPTQAAVGLAAAGVLIGVLPRDRRTRRAAVLWLLPAAWAVDRAVDAVWAAVAG